MKYFILNKEAFILTVMSTVRIKQENITHCASILLPATLHLPFTTSQNPLVILAATLKCVLYTVTETVSTADYACNTVLRVYMSLYACCACISRTHKSAVAQSFVSVAEADTSWYGPWHCQHEAPPLLPPQKLWLLKGIIHHWTSVLRFDTIVQILPFCPLSPRFLASDLFHFLSGFFLRLSSGWIHLRSFSVCRLQTFLMRS